MPFASLSALNTTSTLSVPGVPPDCPIVTACDTLMLRWAFRRNVPAPVLVLVMLFEIVMSALVPVAVMVLVPFSASVPPVVMLPLAVKAKLPPTAALAI